MTCMILPLRAPLFLNFLLHTSFIREREKLQRRYRRYAYIYVFAWCLRIISAYDRRGAIAESCATMRIAKLSRIASYVGSNDVTRRRGTQNYSAMHSRATVKGRDTGIY